MIASKVLSACKYFYDKGYGNKQVGQICIKKAGAPSWYTNCDWCDVTVSAALYTAAETSADKAMLEKYGYEQATINTQKARKIDGAFFRSPKYAKPGDIVFFRWNCANDDNFDHTGIVIKNYGTYLLTFEGNAGSSKVGYYKRDYKYCKAFVRVNYAAEPTKKTYLTVNGTKNSSTIKAWNKLMKAWGYSVAVSGSETANSLKCWQKHLKKWGYYNKSIDGKLGVYTIIGTQKLLKKKGYYTGKCDGKSSTDYIKAMQKYLNAYIKKGTISL